jgi:RND family efflux transporter MFP subunit
MSFRRLLILAPLAAAACGKEAPPPPQPPQVTVATPLAREVTDWDEYTGRFEAVDDVQLRARVSGQVTGILFRDGQDVRAGQVLFQIDPRPFQALVAQAEAQVSSAEATLANARSELARSQSLVAEQAVSRAEFEQRQAGERTALASLAAARATVRQRRLDLSFATVRAPISGRISDRRVSPGDYVTAGETDLTRIVTINPIWFRFEGAESFYLKYLRQDEAGQRRSSRTAGNLIEIGLADENGYRWRGRMSFLDNAIDPSSGTISAHASVPNPDGFLTPGMYGRARLIGSGTYRAMLIPDEAISTDQTRRLVWVVGRDGKAVQRPVETGAKVEGLRIVRAGLAPTDRIIIEGASRLAPGTAVKTRAGQIRPDPNGDPAPRGTQSTPPASQAKAE